MINFKNKNNIKYKLFNVIIIINIFIIFFSNKKNEIFKIKENLINF